MGWNSKSFFVEFQLHIFFGALSFLIFSRARQFIPLVSISIYIKMKRQKHTWDAILQNWPIWLRKTEFHMRGYGPKIAQ